MLGDDGLAKKLRLMNLRQIASVISNSWDVHPFALPYVNAMRALESMDDNYGADSARSIVTYFLGNAQRWHGNIARLVKIELNYRLENR